MSDYDRMSYAVGIAYGRNLQQQSSGKIDFERFVQGMRDSFTRKPLLLSEAEFRTIYNQFQSNMLAMMGKAREFKALDNKQAGDAFLAENEKKEGVVSLKSGLQYKVIAMGTGPKPSPTDTVTVNYRAALIDGREVDNTWRRNQPATFALKTAISGWREALPMMPVGSRWELYVPAELAYSKQGTGFLIGPNSTLVFEIELLAIKKS